MSSFGADERKVKLQQWKAQMSQRKKETLAKKKENSVLQSAFSVVSGSGILQTNSTTVVSIPAHSQFATIPVLVPQQPAKKSKSNALRARPNTWHNINNQQQQQHTSTQQLTKKTKIQLVVIDPNDENATPPSGAADVSMLLPRAKDLGSDFSNEDKTCFLSSMLAEMAVASPKPLATGAGAARAASTSASASSLGSSAFSLPAVVDSTATKITAAVAKPSTALEGVAALPGSGAAAAGEPTTSTAVVVRGVAYFRQQVGEQMHELTGLCERWATAIRSSAVPEEAVGDINAATGQATLLMSKRFTQFSGLCDMNESNQCFNPGQTARDADLDGFWDVIMMQVEDVKRSFEKLEEKASLGWKEPEARDCRAPKKRKRATDQQLERLRKHPKPGPVTPRRRAAKNRLAAVKRRMRPAASSRPSALGGGGAAAAPTSTTVLTPMRASKRDQALLGTQFLLTPVRRSTRKTPSKYKQSPAADKANITSLLVQADYSYKPNFALAGSGVDGAAPAHVQQQREDDDDDDDGDDDDDNADDDDEEEAVGMGAIDEEEDAFAEGGANDDDAEADDNGGEDASASGGRRSSMRRGGSGSSSRRGSSATLAKYLFGTAIEEDAAVEPRTPGGIQQAPARRSRKMMASRVMATPVGARGGKVAVVTPSAASAPPQPALGGVVRFAAITPGKGMRDQLGTDAIYTPVRRSSRLANTPGANTRMQHTVNKTSELPSDLDYGYVPNAFIN